MIGAPPDAPPPAAEVVVTGARLPDSAGDAAYSVVQVAPDALTDATAIDQALKSVPGFSLYRRTSTLGANPTTQGVSLRAIAGSGASRALVTLDGVPQNDPFGGWVIWTALPSVGIGDARIVRGAGSGPYGSGALTGVVQLDTPQGQQGLSGEASGGSRGYLDGQASAAGDIGSARAFIDVAGQSSDGWIPVRAGRGAVDRPLDLHDWSAAGRVEQDVGPGTTVSARLSGYDEDRGAGVVNASSRASGEQASLTLTHQPGAEGWGWRLQSWVDGSDLYNATATVSNNRNTSVPANVQYATPAVGWGLNAALRRDARPYSFEVGADVRGAAGESREFFNYSVPLDAFTKSRKSGGETTVGGVYAEGSAQAGRWLLTGGLRLDGWADYGAERVELARATGATTLDTHAPDRAGALPTGRLGFRRSLPFGLAWRGATYAGFRAPTLNELHRAFRVGNNVTEANPALNPERLYGVESGLDLKRGAATFSATVFYNRLEDVITNVTFGKGPGTFSPPGLPGVSDTVAAGGIFAVRENAGTVNAEGLEAEAVDAVVPDRLELRAAVAYTHSVVDGGSQAPQLTGLSPALTPRTTATAEARWTPTRPFVLAADLRYQSKSYDDDLNTLELHAAVSVDLRAEYAFTSSWSAFVAADNVLNANIQTAEAANGIYSYDMPRLVRVGVRLRR